MKYFIFGLGVFIFFFGGCGSQKEVSIAPSQKVLPQWYENPPLSNATSLYAVGEGKDKDEAIANALNYMVSTLSVSIESTYNAKTTVKEGSSTSKEGVYTSDISSNVKKIRISNYEVIEAQTLGFKKFAVLIRSDKQKLFSSLESELDQTFALVNSEEKNLANDALQKYLFYKKLKQELDNIPNTLIVMKELKGGFSGEKYLTQLSEIDKKYNYYKSSISFSVRSNVKNLNTPIEKALSKQSFHVKNTNSSMHYTIILDANVQQANAYGFTLARAEVQIVTKDPKGANIASNVLHLTGQSSQGYGVALQDLVRVLNEKIQQEGLDKVLNLNI